MACFERRFKRYRKPGKHRVTIKETFVKLINGTKQKQKTTEPIPISEMTYQTADQEVVKELKEKIVSQLREVYDPEIPVNIYELGLIYALNIDTSNNVDIHMTLTAPGCPVAPMIISQVETKVGELPEINKVNVELVWDPPWNEDMMTDEAKLEVGIF